MNTISGPSLSPRPTSRWFRPILVATLVLVGIWYAAAEAVTHYWYATNEAKLPRNVLPPAGETAFQRLKGFVDKLTPASRQQDIGAAAMEMLKCTFGESLYWMVDGAPAAVTILKWDENSVVGGVEGMHNPGNCLAAAGWQIGGSRHLGLQSFGSATADVTEWDVSRGSLEMRAFSAVFRRFATTGVEKTDRRHGERLDAVLAGRRDAPVYIVLAYLPASVSEDQVDRLFRDVMNSIFDAPAPATPPASSAS